jgi:hypothetical protein
MIRDKIPSTTLQRTAAAALFAMTLTVAVVDPAHASDGSAPTFAVLDPRGVLPAIDRVPLADRLGQIAGARIAIVKSWDDNSGFDETIGTIAADLRQRGAEVTVMDRNTVYSSDDPELWRELHASYDGFVYVAAASSSTTAYAFKWSAGLESGGLPGVVVNFAELNSVGDETNARSGAPVRRAVFDYPPSAMESVNLQASIDAVAAGLTRPLTEPEVADGTIPAPDRPAVFATGTISEVQELFHEMGLTDGLPIVPPTAALVETMLTGTSHSPDELIAEEFPPESLRVTVREVAINAVMSGCKPEHLPVLLASVEAFLSYNPNAMLRSTNSFAWMQVVNGPIRNEIAMNASSNAVGPGNRSNACMGRALRLFITNLGGGHFGENLMSVIGSNSNYAFMFAENEEMSPWPSFAVDAGYRVDENVLTMFVGGWAHSGNYGLGTGIEDVPPDLARFQIPNGATLIVSPAREEALAAQGMSKADLERYLETTACRPLADLRKEGRFQDISAYEGQPDDTCVPRFAEGTISILVAGNDASPMMQGWSMYRPRTVSIDKWK